MHPLDKFSFCPNCGSSRFLVHNFKSKHCEDCGFTYYANPSAANVAVILRQKAPNDQTTNPPISQTTNLPNDQTTNLPNDQTTNPPNDQTTNPPNDQLEILVVRRGKEPAKGTLDLPGGFTDADETGENGVIREVLEETGLTVTRADYLFSIPNLYRYSGMDISTLDMFFRCHVADDSQPHAMDDAQDAQWIALSELRPDDFGLRSVRQGIRQLLALLG